MPLRLRRMQLATAAAPSRATLPRQTLAGPRGAAELCRDAGRLLELSSADLAGCHWR